MIDSSGAFCTPQIYVEPLFLTNFYSPALLGDGSMVGRTPLNRGAQLFLGTTAIYGPDLRPADISGCDS